MQQLLPQQVPAGPHNPPLQGGVAQTPLSQKGAAGAHLFPHAPQLLMSLPRLVHADPQQAKSQNPHPPLLELVLELLDVLMPPVPMLPPFPPVPIAPPLPPSPDEVDDDVPPAPEVSIWVPQPATRSPITLKRKTLCCMEPMLPRPRCHNTKFV